jgi:phosphate starvation-inducible protein PhoH and related proteins
MEESKKEIEAILAEVQARQHKKAKHKYPIILKKVDPRTANQEKIFDRFDEGKHLYIHGTAGTGKTYVACYLAMDAILNHGDFEELVIIRSAVPSRRQGFLPGNEEEKNEIFEVPYENLFTKLFDGDRPYQNLKSSNKVRFISTSYLRGITLENCVVLIEEVQNMNDGEIDTVMTRLGENCRAIICGDTAQNDLFYMHEDSCIDKLSKVVRKMPSFSVIEMKPEDICRNGLVREWLLSKASVQNNI